jgi:hypothetical protein
MTLVGLLILVIILVLLFVFRSRMKKPISFIPEKLRVNYLHLTLLILSFIMLIFSDILALICFVGFLLTLLPSFKAKPKKK